MSNRPPLSVRPWFRILLAVALLVPVAAHGADSGMAPERLERISEMLAGYVEDGVIAGAVSVVQRRGEVVHFDAQGRMAKAGERAMPKDAIFRIYSMTKPVTSVATLILFEEGKLRLTDPVSLWLPELAEPRVLNRPDAPLSDTSPSPAPITVRDLLTHTAGLAYPFTAVGPLQKAMNDAGLSGSNSLLAPDAWLGKLGELPLMFAPGTRWHYSLSDDVLGILIARVSGMPFGEFLRTRLFEPLGMEDTAFYVPAEKLGRFTTNYAVDPSTGQSVVFDTPAESKYREPPAFESGGGGLVSTAEDYRHFAAMLLGDGEFNDVRILSRKTVELMTANNLSDEERVIAPFGPASRGFFEGQGYGLGVSVVENVAATRGLGSVGRNGWGGAAGTWYFVDPVEDLLAVLMIQLMGGTQMGMSTDFTTAVYQAISD